MPPAIDNYKLQVWPRTWPDRYRLAISPKSALNQDHVPILFEHRFFRPTSQAYVTRYTRLTKFKAAYYLRKEWLSRIEENKLGGFYPEEIEAVTNYLPFIGLESVQKITVKLERLRDTDRWLTMTDAVMEMTSLGDRIRHIRDIPKTLTNWVTNDILAVSKTTGIFLTNARWLSATLRYMEIIAEDKELL